MLSKEEIKFIEYWEKNREKEKNILFQLGYGAPWGLIFALPVLVALIFNDWYKRMVPISVGQLITICIAVLAIAVFYAVFRMKFKWDYNEQQYKELKFKQMKNDAA